MDERDQEWLDKNNEEARGEGTSSSGGTRSRGAKNKGKEPEALSIVSMTEDEFELVMGLFEKTTHDKTEHLHLSLETGMDFPAFSPDYEDVFSRDLPPSVFAAFAIPSWIPPSTQLVKLARTVYPHWKERRVDREGHRIIPAVNVCTFSTLPWPSTDRDISLTRLTPRMSPTSAFVGARSRVSAKLARRRYRTRTSFCGCSPRWRSPSNLPKASSSASS
jgi:hypothetical protein